jgi:signal transduction histidine kinase
VKLPSIRSRLLIGVGALQSVVALVSLLLVMRYSQRESQAALDANISSHATALLALVQAPEEQDQPAVLRRELLALPPEDRFRLTDLKDQVIAETPGWFLPHHLPAGERVILSLVSGGVSYRALIVRNAPIVDTEEGEHSSPQRVALVYGTPTAPMDAHVSHVAVSTGLVCFGMLAISQLLTFLIVRIGLGPLDELAAQASLVDASKWEWQAPASAIKVAELKPLSRALSDSIGRLKVAFERERQMFADAAHELKTAVAIIKSTLQLALQAKRPAEEYREGLNRALDDTDRLEALVLGMLQLAAIENLVTGQHAPTDVVSALTYVVEQLSNLAQARGLLIRLSQTVSHHVDIPEQEYVLLASSLLENAIQHSDVGQDIDILIRNHDGWSTLIVEDHGSGISEDVLPHIFERFFRADQSRSRISGGFGLGLAIVRAVVQKYHGTVSVQSTLGRGTKFTVCLPFPSH